ncbi:MAG: hypothetical protein M1830_002473 [Pleopsidium flavum]|nr:MAG: hypothetical protein M1830_002473 [Pleopsidium flavum]
MQLLDSSISILDSGVNDFPRLAKVLQTTRHFELLPEPTLLSAQTSLIAEIAPEVETLLQRVSTHLDKLERREQALIAKAELQEGRLSQQGGRSSTSQSKGKGVGEWKGGVGGGEALRAKQMRQKKERLSYAVERLTLQAQQRERQLRMSMAAQ